jgi:PleD family two-component response regulator
MSFGVSAAAPGSFSYEQVFPSADRALYQAKAAGRNCVRNDGDWFASSLGALPELAVNV